MTRARTCALFLLSSAPWLTSAGCAAAGDEAPPRPPNLVLILADDLGYGELGCYGQEKIRTPRIDALAAEGMRFTNHYSGSPVCAPSRCVLLTGLHTGHAFIRDNDEMPERGDVWHDPELEGQRPIPDETVTLAELLRARGYATAAIGKWGLGWVGSSGDPNAQGFDFFLGHVCQRVAHNHYPTHLWRNGEKLPLHNPPFSAHQKLPADADPNDPTSYVAYRGCDYAPDLMIEAALRFVRDHADRPFFLYYPTPVPHVALQVPADSLAEYEGAFPETPYRGDRGYLPHRTPRAAYAAMITRLDRDVGRLLDLLDELGLRDDTLVVFTSDNGPTWVGGVDKDFFASQGGLRGRKAQLYEGGIRVPAIVRWPGRVPAGTTSALLSGFQDWLPTFCAAAGAPIPPGLDGVSLLPELTGRPEEQERHEYLYWEYAKRMQAARFGRYKAFRPKPSAPIQIYDLAEDPAESRDLAGERPELVERAAAIFAEAHTDSEFFRLRG
ncbi:MAG: N-acetylgalactosamine-6-sulfatase [Planctomycetota bacterium]|nr:MAG: N-acetylgalactosamine-6-sulfatase [Planctomycetota bacterium]